jgi:hypothetical protein
MVTCQRLCPPQLTQQLHKRFKHHNIECLQLLARTRTFASMLVSMKKLARMQSVEMQGASAMRLVGGVQDFGSASRQRPQLVHSSELKSFLRAHRKSPRFA